MIASALNFDRPGDYGLNDLRPGEAYWDVFPSLSDIPNVAYHFKANYESESLSNPSLIDQISFEVDRWIEAWREQDQPKLLVSRIGPEEYILYDTRGIAENNIIEFIDEAQAALALLGTQERENEHNVEWALRRGICLDLEGRITPLATSSVELLSEFDRTRKDRLSDVRARSHPVELSAL